MGRRSSFRNMRIGSRTNLLRLINIVLLGFGVSASLPAQEQWTGVGAIGATAMYMDTTTIIRAGSIRKVWIKSLDSAPKSFVTGKDTLKRALAMFGRARRRRSALVALSEVTSGSDARSKAFRAAISAGRTPSRRYCGGSPAIEVGTRPCVSPAPLRGDALKSHHETVR